MSINIGAFNQTQYDNCAYSQYVKETTSPLQYNLYTGAVENCKKCRENGFWLRNSPAVVDIESELRNQTRPQSRCNQFRYNPSCRKTGLCTSTYQRNIPIILDPSICSIINTNILRPTSIGYKLEDPNFCRY